MSTMEFNPSVETVTAVIHQALETGESYWEPIVIGHYGAGGAGEVWIECEGQRILIHKDSSAAVMKQLKRAMKMAAEIEEG